VIRPEAAPFVVALLVLVLAEVVVRLTTRRMQTEVGRWLDIELRVARKDSDAIEPRKIRDLKLKGLNEDNMVAEFSRSADLITLASGLVALGYGFLTSPSFASRLQPGSFDIPIAALAVFVLFVAGLAVTALTPISRYHQLVRLGSGLPIMALAGLNLVAAIFFQLTSVSSTA
jgi:hypothetical protein